MRRMIVAPGKPGTPQSSWPALYAVVAVFGAVRFACLFNDLWLDEIWSLRLVGQLHSPVEILTRLWHDNNHPLNSLFLYLLGPAQADWAYRLLSWFTGTATVALAGLIGRRQWHLLHPGDEPAKARAAGLIAAVLVGGSYLLIHYSSEARGYAPAVGFGFLAIFALLHAPGRPMSWWAAVYGLACVLGLLSHLVAFQVMLGGLVWSVAVAFRTGGRWRDRIVQLVCWQFVPWIFLGLYYLGFVQKLEVGGGPTLALSTVLGQLSAYSLDLPGGLGTAVALPVFLGVVAVAAVLIGRHDRALAGFYLTAIIVAPALGLLGSRFVLLYPRYFIVSAAVGLLLAAYALARLWDSGRAARAAAAVVLAAFLLGGGVHTARLLRDGRGQYQAALRYVGAHTPTRTVTLSSDSDFRNVGIIAYYAKAVGPARYLQYYSGTNLPPGGPQWVLLHRLDGETPPTADLFAADGAHYRQEGVYPHGPLSGWTWYLFRNLDPGVLPAAGR